MAEDLRDVAPERSHPGQDDFGSRRFVARWPTVEVFGGEGEFPGCDDRFDRVVEYSPDGIPMSCRGVVVGGSSPVPSFRPLPQFIVKSGNLTVPQFSSKASLKKLANERVVALA
jgi:hypothetical protein